MLVITLITDTLDRAEPAPQGEPQTLSCLLAAKSYEVIHVTIGPILLFRLSQII